MNTIGTIVIAIMILGLISIVLFNSIIKAKNQVENAFGSVDVMLKKRYDLIPNLIETVKTYLNYEKDVLEKLTKLRTNYNSNSTSMEDKVKLGNEIESEMGKLNFSLENYPDLKASQNFVELQKSWNEAEEQVAASRRFYNSAVTDFNNTIEQFPNSIVAKIGSYKRKEVFVIVNESERENISAKNAFNN